MWVGVVIQKECVIQRVCVSSVIECACYLVVCVCFGDMMSENMGGSMVPRGRFYKEDTR